MFNDKLKELRLNNNLSTKEVANILSVSRITYSHYEVGERIIPLERLNNLCTYYKISFDYIFGFIDLKSYNNTNNNLDLEIISKRLKEFRKDNNLTQEKLAKYLNTTFSTISGYELKRFLIPTAFLYSICSKYNISADYLLGRIDNPKYLKK